MNNDMQMRTIYKSLDHWVSEFVHNLRTGSLDVLDLFAGQLLLPRVDPPCGMTERAPWPVVVYFGGRVTSDGLVNRLQQFQVC